jgi:hypothetical protein
MGKSDSERYSDLTWGTEHTAGGTLDTELLVQSFHFTKKN